MTAIPPARALPHQPSPGAPPAGRAGQSRLRKIFLYAASRGVTEALLGLRGLLLARLLGPEAFGGWALFRITLHYAAFARLGVHRGLEREVSQQRPSRHEDGARDELSARTALGFGLLTGSALAVAALVTSFGVADPRLALGLRALAAALVVEQTWIYSLIYIRSRGELRRYATLEVAAAALHVVLAGLLALVWGLAGALFAFTLACACGTALALRRVPWRPALSRERLVRLLRIGFPQALTLIVGVALVTVDKLVVAAYGGATLLGYYAFAASVAGVAGAFAWVVRTVVFPEVYGRARDAGQVAALREHLRNTILPFARLYPPLVGALALAVAPAVGLFAPQYAEAVPPARLFLFSGASVGLVGLAALGVVAADRQRVLPLLSGTALLANFGLSVLALRLGAGLEGVAAGALVSQAGYAAAVLVLVARSAELELPGRWVARALVPLAYCASVVFGLGRLLPGIGPASAGAALGLYAALLLPLLPWVRAEAGRLRWKEALTRGPVAIAPEEPLPEAD